MYLLNFLRVLPCEMVVRKKEVMRAANLRRIICSIGIELKTKLEFVSVSSPHLFRNHV